MLFSNPLFYVPPCCAQETSCGQFAGECVTTTAKIIADAEGTLDAGGNYSFIRNFTPKPLPTIEVSITNPQLRMKAVKAITTQHTAWGTGCEGVTARLGMSRGP